MGSRVHRDFAGLVDHALSWPHQEVVQQAHAAGPVPHEGQAHRWERALERQRQRAALEGFEAFLRRAGWAR